MTSKTSWEEIKALAADFQRTQLSGTLQKLSDRNCVEVVKKLTELNLIELIFTLDGKEYITPQHLVKEISDELIVNGGRIHLSELVTLLNVDYSHVEAKAAELTKDSFGDISLVLGQLVNTDYKDTIAKEINERLQQQGSITIAELTKLYDLPADFLQELVSSRLQSHIDGVQDTEDRRAYFTQTYLEKYRSRIVGVLSAVTKPVSLKQIINKYSFPEKIFYNFAQSLIKNGRLAGSIVGSGGSRTYVPNIYARTQNEWVENFYKQNGYLEYDGLVRIGINDPKGYIKKKSGFGDLTYLSTCCVGKAIMYQVESDLEECISSESWIDLMTVLPSVLSSEDVRELIQTCLDSNAAFKKSCILLSDTVVVAEKLVHSSMELFDSAMKSKAEEDLKEGILFAYFAAAQKLKNMEFEAELSRKDRRKKKQGKVKEVVVEVFLEEEPKTKGKKNNRPRGKLDQTKTESSDDKKELQVVAENQKASEPKELASETASPVKQKQPDESGSKDADTTVTEETKIGGTKSGKIEKETKDDKKKKQPGGKERSGAGGGTQGREVKTKAVKKKYKPTAKGDGDDSDTEVVKSKPVKLTFMTIEEITDFLQRKCEALEDCPLEVVTDLAKYLRSYLEEKYIQIARSLFSSSTRTQEKEKLPHEDDAVTKQDQIAEPQDDEQE